MHTRKNRVFLPYYSMGIYLIRLNKYNLYRYLTFRKTIPIPAQKVFWTGFAPKPFGTRTKLTWSALRINFEYAPKGFGANGLQIQSLLYKCFISGKPKLPNGNFFAYLPKTFSRLSRIFIIFAVGKPLKSSIGYGGSFSRDRPFHMGTVDLLRLLPFAHQV